MFRSAFPSVATVLTVTVLATAATAPTHANSTATLTTPRALAAIGPASGTSPGLGSVILRRQVEVDDEYVRLEDLFGGDLPNPGTPVAYAPPPGERLVLDRVWLYNVARSHGIAWKPLGVQAEVVVSRAAATVSDEDILQAVHAELVARGLPPETELDPLSALRPVAVPASAPNPVGVVDADFDLRTNRFSAVVELPAGDPRAHRLRVSGRIYEIVEVPVLARSVSRNAVIGNQDIKWMKMRSDRLGTGVVTDADGVVGMAARRSLRAGEPVRARDLERPSLVSRGDAVTMIMHTPFMTLTAVGRALEDGAEGEVVRIRNERSRKTVLGRVTEPRTVVVDGPQNTAFLN